MSKRIKTSEVLPRSLSYARDLWLYYHYFASTVSLLMSIGGKMDIVDKIDLMIFIYIVLGYVIGIFGFILTATKRSIELDRLEEEFVDPDPPLFCSRKKMFLLGTPIALPFAIVYIIGVYALKTIRYVKSRYRK